MQGFVDELEKQAIDPLSIGIGAAGGHIATNLAINKAMKGHRLMPDILRQGYQHGLERKKTGPFREAMVTKAIGPEVPMEYHHARGLGRVVRVLKKAKTDAQKNRILKKVTDKTGKGSVPKEIRDLLPSVGPDTSTADIVAKIRKARLGLKSSKNPATVSNINKAVLREKVHQRAVSAGRKSPAPISRGARLIAGGKGVHEKHQPSRLGRAAQNIPEVAAVAGTAAGSPWAAKALGHLVLNRGRAAVAKTKFGKKVVDNEMKKGLSGKLSETRQKAKSILVSPGFAGVGDVGAAVRRAAKGPEAAKPKKHTGLVASLAGRSRAALAGLRERLSLSRWTKSLRAGQTKPS